MINMSSLHQLYLEEIRQERGKFLSKPDTHFSVADIEKLPIPVQRYFRHCGYLQKEKKLYAQITWKDAEMRLSPVGKWMRLRCYQFNAVPEPVRIVHMKARLGGILPFGARDKFQGGHGNMLIRLLGLITLSDVRGKEMDESALVTLLAEALLIPAYALQDYIRWTPLGPDRAEGELSWNKIKVKGVFYFNGLGEFTRFETGDRWRTEGGSTLCKTPWRVHVSDYRLTSEGIRQPSKAVAAWLIDGQWTDYFRGEIGSIGGLAKP